MKIKNTMYGMNFKTLEELEELQKWLILRGLMATINKETWCVEISARLNGKWAEDTNGDLVCLK